MEKNVSNAASPFGAVMRRLPVEERLIPFFTTIGSAFGAAQDLGVGALIAVLFAGYFGVEPTWFILCLGAFLAVLPDMDIVVPSITGSAIHYNHHETFMHRPILAIPAAAAIAYFVGSLFGVGAFAAALTAACVLYHFLHDTPGGIAWGWPLSRTYVAPWGKVMIESSFDPVSSQMRFLHGFLTPTRTSLTELTICAVTMALAITIVTHTWWGVVPSVLGAFLVVCVWFAYRRLSLRGA